MKWISLWWSKNAVLKSKDRSDDIALEYEYFCSRIVTSQGFCLRIVCWQCDETEVIVNGARKPDFNRINETNRANQNISFLVNFLQIFAPVWISAHIFAWPLPSFTSFYGITMLMFTRVSRFMFSKISECYWCVAMRNLRSQTTRRNFSWTWHFYQFCQNPN